MSKTKLIQRLIIDKDGTMRVNPEWRKLAERDLIKESFSKLHDVCIKETQKQAREPFNDVTSEIQKLFEEMYVPLSATKNR